MIIAVCVLMAVWSCGSNTPSKPVDAAVDAFFSKCGHPGDTGNEMGIGKFCTSLSDCSGTPNAPLCSQIGDPQTHFCTHTCSATGSSGQCGTATSCQCNAQNQCGCTPTACTM